MRKLYWLIISLAYTSLLSACDTVGCIKAEDASHDRIVDIVKTSPEGVDPLIPGSYWVKSQARTAEESLGISVKTLDVNMCAKNSNLSVYLSPSDKEYIEINELEFNKGDRVVVKIKHIYNPVSIEVCNGKESNAYIGSFDDCKVVADTSKLKIENFSSPLDGTPLNIIFPSSVKSRWIKGKLISFPKDSDHEWFSSPLNSESKCKIRETPVWSDQEINIKCKNVCGVYQNGQEIVNQDCAFVETNESTLEQLQQDPQSAKHYLPGLDGYFKSDHSYGLVTILKRFSGHVGNGMLAGTENVVEHDKSKLVFTFQKEYQKYLGGYQLEISRYCPKKNSGSFFYSVGDKAPGIKPGEAGSEMIPIEGNISRFTINTGKGKNIYYGVKDYGDNYQNNEGSFEVTARVPIEIRPIFSYIIDQVSTQVQRILYGNIDKTLIGKIDVGGTVGGIYRAIVNGILVDLIRVIIMLYIVIYSLMYMIGMVKNPLSQIVIGIIKISIMLVLLSPSSWIFFNEYLFSLFIHGSEELLSALTGVKNNETSSFAFIDKMIARFGRAQTWMQLLSLIFAGPVGWLALFAIFFAIWNLFAMIINLFIMYLIALIMIAMLLAISPLFIILILFQKTKAIFDAWLKMLIQFTLQPVMAFAGVALLHELSVALLYTLLGYDVCSGCILTFDMSEEVPNMCLLRFWLPYGYSPEQDIEGRMVDTYGGGGTGFFGIPITITAIISFVILTHALEKFVNLVPTIVTSLFGSMGTELSRPAADVVSSVKGAVGQDQESTNRRAQQQQHSKKRGAPKKTKAEAKGKKE